MTQIDPMNRERAAAVLLQDNILLGLGNLWDRTKMAFRKTFVSNFPSIFLKNEYRGYCISILIDRKWEKAPMSSYP